MQNELPGGIYETNIKVHAPYNITESEGKKYIQAENPSKISKSYNPFEVKYLFEELVKVDLKKESSIIEFCNQYGLLTGRLDKHEAFIYQTRTIDPNYYSYHTESLDVFKIETEKVKQVAFAIKEIKDNKEASQWLKEWVSKLKFFLTSNTSHYEVAKASSSDWFILAKAIIIEIMAPNLKYVSSYPLLTHEGHIIPSHTTDHLLGAIYQQLYELLISAKKIGYCFNPKCKKPFVIRSNNNNRFCPAKENEKISPCKNSFNVWKYRVRKEIKEGKTKQEIADKKGITLERLEFLLKQ